MWFQWLRWLGQPGLYRTVIVNLIDPGDMALRGVLWRRRGPWLVLRQAAVIKADRDNPMPADGDLVVHRSNVSFVQVLP